MTTITTPSLPTKTADMSWDDFTVALKEASETYEITLTTEMPTPEITADRGTPEWNVAWFAQRAAADKRNRELMKYNAKLVLEVGKAIAAITPDFRSLDVEYEGCGDAGEICDISVYLDRPILLDEKGERRLYTNDENEAFLEKTRAATNLISGDLREWLDETCWAIAYDQHPGLEINEGSFGSLIVEPEDEDVEGSKLVLRLRHTERVERPLDDEELA